MDDIPTQEDDVFELSDERRAELAPKLRALIADLAKLHAFVTPETEPVTPSSWSNGDHDDI